MVISHPNVVTHGLQVAGPPGQRSSKLITGKKNITSVNECQQKVTTCCKAGGGRAAQRSAGEGFTRYDAPVQRGRRL